MVRLADIQRQTEELSQEDREGLVAYLLHGLPGIGPGPDDAEVRRREEELEDGSVQSLTHAEFLKQVGRAES